MFKLNFSKIFQAKGLVLAEAFQLYLQDDDGVKKYVAAKSAPSNSTVSRFFRSVKFTSVDSTNNLQAVFEVKVQWLDGAKVRTIRKDLTVYNDL